MVLAAALCAVGIGQASAQVHSFANNNQHTSQYSVPAQRMNRIKWVVQMNENLTGGFAHYGQPLVTAGNTILLMVRTNTNGYDLIALDGNTGSQKYRIPTGYTQPPGVVWLVPVQPAISVDGLGTHVFFPGAGGTLWKLDDPDSNTPGTPTRIVFYGTEADYLANQAAFDSTVNLNTPITVDSEGTLFFGTRVTNTAPAPLNTTQSVFVRIDGTTGTASWVTAGAATNDANVSRITHGSAPALTVDENTVYVVMKGTTSVTAPYLVALDATTLGTLGKVALKDPRNGLSASVNDLSTASPMVAPDSDVYLGVLGNPSNGSRGWLLRFSGDLSVTKTPGGFGWDYTAGLIPASMVPSYTGPSSYLLFCKYNNYVSGDGDGANNVAVLDPNTTQVDFHASAGGLVTMREVFKMISPSPDEEYPTRMGAAREWCINACAVNPATNSIYFNCEDGHLYRWDMTTNSLSESMQLNSGVGQPYVPTVIGPDGTLFTLNGGYLFAIGNPVDVGMTLTSDQPDVRFTVDGDLVTFTASVTGNSGTPTGSVTFEDTTIVNYAPVTTTLATVPLDGNGVAVYQVALSGGAKVLGDHWGNHRIKAIYSGDGTYGTAEAKLAQKVHAFASIVTATPSGTFDYPGSVTLSVNVAKSGAGTEIPSGYVTLTDEGTGQVVDQRPLDASGNVSFSLSGFTPGAKTYSAFYYADTWFEASTGTGQFTITDTTSLAGSASPASTGYGSPTLLEADVTAGASGQVPAGNVEFYEGATLIGVAAVDSNGHAEFETFSLAVGSHTLHAEFVGDAGWADSTSSTFSHDVTSPTATTVGGSPDPSSYGATVTFTATVGSTLTGAGTPTGTVTFKEGATVLGSAPVDGSGQATLDVSTLGVGSHTVTAEFAGTGGYLDSSGNDTVEVTSATTTGLASSLNPSTIGVSVTFTASVAGSGGTPTGSVTFYDGATALGTVAVDGSGQAQLSTGSLSYGSHSITASFSGTNGWLDSGSSAVSQTVNDVVAPSQPINVTAVSGPTTGKITVAWSASTDDNQVSHYEIWRSNKASSGFTLLTTTSATNYVDTVGKKQRRYYYIIAVDVAGNKSVRSATVNATGAPRVP